MLSFIFFFLYYNKVYNLGVKQGDKSYYLSYLDLKKVVKRLAVGFLMFLVGTYFMSFAEGFTTTICKGCVLSILVLPPLYRHYNDESKYVFHYNKGD